VARRLGNAAYGGPDREALQNCADSVDEALALAVHLGHRPLLKAYAVLDGIGDLS
jgi:hypothetical protein